jgi:hypothetical protein
VKSGQVQHLLDRSLEAYGAWKEDLFSVMLETMELTDIQHVG